MARSDTAAVVAITALAAVLRLAALGEQSFWFDEAVTADLLARPFGDMLDAIPRSESTPPLYYALAWVWSRAFGASEWGLRSLSAVCGVATVPVMWAAARELADRRVALAVAALAAVSPFLVWYSQEARSYALLILLTALSVWLVARIVREPTVRSLALWSLVGALALATHYFALFMVLAQAGVILWRTRSAAGAVAVGAVGAAGLALLPLALDQQGRKLAGFISNDPLGERLAAAVKQLAFGFDAPGGPVPALLLTVLVAGAGIALAAREPDRARRRGVRLCAVLAAAMFAGPLVAGLLGADYLLTRNLAPAWLPLVVIVAVGLLARGPARAALGVLTLLTLATTVGVMFEPSWQREDWRAAAKAIGPPARRAVLVTEKSQAVPVRLYRRDLRRAPASPGSVEEIVALARRGGNLGDRVPQVPVGAIRQYGLKVVQHERTPTWELIRLRGVNGRPFIRAQLRQLGLDSATKPAAVLLEN